MSIFKSLENYIDNSQDTDKSDAEEPQDLEDLSPKHWLVHFL